MVIAQLTFHLFLLFAFLFFKLESLIKALAMNAAAINAQ